MGHKGIKPINIFFIFFSLNVSNLAFKNSNNVFPYPLILLTPLNSFLPDVIFN